MRGSGIFVLLLWHLTMAAHPDSLAQTESDSYVGVTFAAEELDVAAEITGILESVHVRIGDRVEAGEILASFRDEPIRRELTMAEASLAAARAQREQRQIEVALAEQRLERRQQLSNVLSEEELAELISERDAARAALAAATALVEERKTRVEALRDDLARAEIRAPFAGTVSVRHEEGGALLQPGAPVVRILSRDIWLRFAVPPAVGRQLRTGQPVTLRCEGAIEELIATVRHIAPDVDPMADMVFVEADIDETSTDQDGLVVGLVARVRLRGDGGADERPGG